jgi:hypothetical protein
MTPPEIAGHASILPAPSEMPGAAGGAPVSSPLEWSSRRRVLVGDGLGVLVALDDGDAVEGAGGVDEVLPAVEPRAGDVAQVVKAMSPYGEVTGPPDSVASPL